MNYSSPFETGTSNISLETHGRRSIRKLTESQGARSGVYKVTHEPTGKEEIQTVEKSKKTSSEVLRQSEQVKIAKREHVGRLLRDCEAKSKALFESTDPVDFALLGSNLVYNLQDLWNYRESREEDFSEILNLIQITLAKQEFETLSKEKRLALFKIFQEVMTNQTVGVNEVERAIQLLSDAGFDIWQGMQMQEEEPE